MKKTLTLLITMIMLVALTGCGSKQEVADDVYMNQEAKQYPYTFVDRFGNEVTIESVPESYISFSPEITETIYALGKGSNLIGRSTYCNYPEEALEVEDLGTLFSYNMEVVLEKDPDIVFLSSMVSEEVYQQFISAGMTPISIDYDKDLKGTIDQIIVVGEILNCPEEAAYIGNEIQEAIAEVKARAVNREPVSLYFVVGAGEYTSTATGDTFLHDIIQTVGATNVAEKGTSWRYTVEQLVEDDPDVVVTADSHGSATSMVETVQSLEGYKDLRAVKEGRLYAVDKDIFYRQGPRVIDALYALEALLDQ